MDINDKKETHIDQGSNYLESQEDAGISIPEVIDFLRARCVQLFVIAVITGMISLGVCYFIRMGAGTKKLATYEFLFTFDGATENQYPNGIPFSPQDMLAIPVLDAVYVTMDLQGEVEIADFRRIFTIARSGTEMRLLQLDFEQKLANTKLTAAERTPLETQYRNELASLKSNNFILTGDFTKTNLSDLQMERVLSAILVAWSNFTQTIRGVNKYDISVPNVTNSDKLTNDTDYLIAAETLRSISMRTNEAATILLAKPGGKIARDKTGKNIDDLISEIEASYRVDVLPTYTNFLRLAYAQNPDRVDEVFSNRIETSKRAVALAEAEAKMTTESFQNYIMLSSGGTTGQSGADAGHGQFTSPPSNMPIINMNADFFDRIIGQGVAAKDTAYRQTGNDLQLKTRLKVLKLKDDLAFDEWLLKQIRPETKVTNDNQTDADRLTLKNNGGETYGNSEKVKNSQDVDQLINALPDTTSKDNALPRPRISVQSTLVYAQAVQANLATFAARAQEFYTILSARNLNASSMLYSSQSAPMVFETGAMSLKQIFVATCAAEFVVLGTSLALMAGRRRKLA